MSKGKATETLKNIIRQRSKIRTDMRKIYPGRGMIWNRGTLIFSDTGKKVPEAPTLKKPPNPYVEEESVTNPSPPVRRWK